MSKLTAERLRELLEYFPETGGWWWLVPGPGRTKDMFFGCRASGNYLTIRVDGVLYSSHRLAWLWMTGKWPVDEVDHWDLDRQNNRWKNLREATKSQNRANLRPYANCASGAKGVRFYEPNQKWLARISVNGKRIHLGYRETRKEAVALYEIAAREAYGEFARFA